METLRIEELNTKLRDALKPNFHKSKPFRPGKALIISWEGEPGLNQPRVALELSDSLRESYGCHIEDFKLPLTKAEMALKTKISSLLGKNEPAENPSIIYYRGQGLIKDGKPFWRLRDDRSSPIVDWFSIQALIENAKSNIVLLIDYDYGVTPTRTTTGHGVSAFRLSGQRQPRTTCGRLEILGAPQNMLEASQNVSPFTHKLTKSLEAQRKQPYCSLKDIQADLRKQSDCRSVYENLSPFGQPEEIRIRPYCQVYKSLEVSLRNDTPITQMTQMTQRELVKWASTAPPQVREIQFLELPTSHISRPMAGANPGANSLQLHIEYVHSQTIEETLETWVKQSPPCVVQLRHLTGTPISRGKGKEPSSAREDILQSLIDDRNETSRWSQILPTRNGLYRKVVVLPIAWDPPETSFSPKNELHALIDAFKNHFDYTVQDIFGIPGNDDAQEELDREVRLHLDPLDSRDLLVVIYNGHGRDGYTNSHNMIFASGSSYHTVNWTKIVRSLDAAPCDVLQILDCCFAGFGTKGDAENDDLKRDPLKHLSIESKEFQGRNEILAACGRDTRTGAGENSSMKLFTQMFEKLASEQNSFTVHKWYHDIETEAGRRSSNRLRWSTPYWKMNPRADEPNGIRLTTKKAIINGGTIAEVQRFRVRVQPKQTRVRIKANPRMMPTHAPVFAPSVQPELKIVGPSVDDGDSDVNTSGDEADIDEEDTSGGFSVEEEVLGEV
ncbi:tyrosine-protein phosphatase non-receptor type 6 [Seiridium cupressi]